MSGRRRPRVRTARPATIHDVARAAKVSTATVSRVLAGLNLVSDELVRRVQAAARKLSYRPNRVARSLRARASHTVGLLLPTIESPFFAGMLRGLEDKLRRSDYAILTGTSAGDPAREQAYIDLFRAEGVAGVVTVPGQTLKDLYQELIDADVPTLVVGSELPALTADRVAVAERAAAAAAVRHLMSLGHRRIAILARGDDDPLSRERLAGALAALEQGEVASPRELLRQVGGGIDAAVGPTAELLALPRPPTALFSLNEELSLGALRALNEAGVRVPEAMAVVGFGDAAWATASNPPLTTVALPAYELGAIAAGLLLDRIREPGRAVEQTELEARLIVRGSCGAATSATSRARRGAPAQRPTAGEPWTAALAAKTAD